MRLITTMNLCAFGVRCVRSTRQRDALRNRASGSVDQGPEPTCTSGRGERFLLRGEFSRWPHEPCCRSRPAEKVRFDFSDQPPAELQVAAPSAFVRPLEHAAPQARADVV